MAHEGGYLPFEVHHQTMRKGLWSRQMEWMHTNCGAVAGGSFVALFDREVTSVGEV
jgi:hypothetical protein